MTPTARHLAFLGTTTIDVVQVADSLPPINQKGWARAAYLDAGGPAANAAITASILGSQVILHSAFGEGPLGDLLKSLVDQHQVTRIGYGNDPAVPVSSIWVAAGNRTLLSTAASFDGPHEDVVDLRGAAGVLLDGFYPDLARAAAHTASELEIPVVLDCGSWREVFLDLLPLASVAILSEEFRIPDHADEPPDRVIRTMLDQYPLRFAAVSRGGDPIAWATRSESGEVAVPSVVAVDTLGAGDVLHGAFMHFAFGEGFDDLRALQQAASVAASSCEHLGTRAGVDAWVSDRSV